MLKRIRYSLAYLRKPPWDTGISPPELLAFIDSHPAGSALDLGCGTGTNVLTLAQHGWQVTGIDFIPRAVHAARKKLSTAGFPATILLGDVTHLDNLNPVYDFILDIGCLHSLDKKAYTSTIHQIHRLLKPTGTFLSYCFLRIDSQQPHPGITEADIQALAGYFSLDRRVDSLDRHRNRHATWLTFHVSK